ncbi:MAG: 2-dehydropantoate 2-reductase [Treponemataceae bacterium]|nr:MAG: 2-dehydropantoate 2-reductase [Treponemataceae bacterium]
MKKIESVLLAGAGAVGLTVGEAIWRYDSACISVLAKGERLERYRSRGLFVNGVRIGFALADGSPVCAPADLIIVASKFHHLSQIIADIRPYVGKDTIILSLLNGITSEELIGAVYGAERLPLAFIIATDAFHEDGKTTVGRRGVINFGDAGGKNGAREQLIADFFSRAGVAYEIHADMKRRLWYKFMINAGANQVSAILRLPYAAMQKKGADNPGEIPEVRELVESAMREVIAVANAQGIDLGEGDIDNWYEAVNSLNPAGYTSMCQDVLARRKTEVEMFSLTVIEYGKKYGVSAPVNEVLYRALKTIERQFGV